jgi:lipopolysaccharide/colanic/teichoic acid biosynthesis glycosyltransferase
MNKIEINPNSLLSRIGFMCALVFFLPLLLFISLYALLETGTPIFVRRRFGGFGPQARYAFQFRIPVLDRGDPSLDAKRTCFGDFLYNSGLYLLPVLVSFTFGWGTIPPRGEPANFQAVRKYDVRSLQDYPGVGKVTSGKHESAAATPPW